MSFSASQGDLVCRACGSSMLTILLTFISTLYFTDFLPGVHSSGLKLPSSVYSAPFSNLKPHHGDANIAYFIQATNSTANHVPRLISRLHHPENVYMIHFDTKVSPRDVDSIMDKTRERTPLARFNVLALEQQVVTYAGFSMVINTLGGMDALLKLHEEHPWDFFINLSGSDYPLVDATTQRRILGKVLRNTADGRRNFFNIDRTTESWPKFYSQRLRNFHVDEVMSHYNTDGRLLNSNIPNPLAESKRVPFETVKGSAWMILSHDFVQYSVDSDLSRQLIALLGHMRACDEHFFVTLAFNTPQFKNTMIGTNLRRDIWHHEGESAGSHPFVLDEKRGNGKYRFKEVLESSFAFHARKFRETESEIMDIIDKFARDPKRQRRVQYQIEVVLRESGKDIVTGKNSTPV